MLFLYFNTYFRLLQILNYKSRSGPVRVEYINDRKKRSHARIDRIKTIMKKSNELVGCCGGRILVIIEDERSQTYTYTNDDAWWRGVTRTGFKLPFEHEGHRLDGGANKVETIRMVKGNLQRFVMTDLEQPTPRKSTPGKSDMNFISFKGLSLLWMI